MYLTASPDLHFTREEIVAVLATSSIRSGADRTMWLVRTSFLHHIATDERDEVECIQQCDLLPPDESDCFCRNQGKKYATVFAKRCKKRTQLLLSMTLTLHIYRVKPAGKPMYTGRAAIL
jgi:hypothetical protein